MVGVEMHPDRQTRMWRVKTRHTHTKEKKEEETGLACAPPRGVNNTTQLGQEEK